jgi:hypothetical protein
LWVKSKMRMRYPLCAMAAFAEHSIIFWKWLPSTTTEIAEAAGADVAANKPGNYTMTSNSSQVTQRTLQTVKGGSIAWESSKTLMRQAIFLCTGGTVIKLRRLVHNAPLLHELI